MKQHIPTQNKTELYNFKLKIDKIDEDIKLLNDLKNDLIEMHFVNKHAYYQYVNYHLTDESFSASEKIYIREMNKGMDILYNI